MGYAYWVSEFEEVTANSSNASDTKDVDPAVLGVLMDKGAYVPVRNAPRISALITAIGVSFLLENLDPWLARIDLPD